LRLTHHEDLVRFCSNASFRCFQPPFTENAFSNGCLVHLVGGSGMLLRLRRLPCNVLLGLGDLLPSGKPKLLILLCEPRNGFLVLHGFSVSCRRGLIASALEVQC
jgi:hypothetical protein